MPGLVNLDLPTCGYRNADTPTWAWVALPAKQGDRSGQMPSKARLKPDKRRPGVILNIVGSSDTG